MTQKLTRWGRSIGCRLPVAVLEATVLKAGDYVRIRARDDGSIQVQPVGKLHPAEPEGSGNVASAPVEAVW